MTLITSYEASLPVDYSIYEHTLFSTKTLYKLQNIFLNATEIKAYAFKGKVYATQPLCEGDFKSLPTIVKASTALSRFSLECAADNCTRILAFSLGTTGKKNPMT